VCWEKVVFVGLVRALILGRWLEEKTAPRRLWPLPGSSICSAHLVLLACLIDEARLCLAVVWIAQRWVVRPPVANSVMGRNHCVGFAHKHVNLIARTYPLADYCTVRLVISCGCLLTWIWCMSTVHSDCEIVPNCCRAPVILHARIQLVLQTSPPSRFSLLFHAWFGRMLRHKHIYLVLYFFCFSGVSDVFLAVGAKLARELQAVGFGRSRGLRTGRSFLSCKFTAARGLEAFCFHVCVFRFLGQIDWRKVGRAAEEGIRAGKHSTPYEERVTSSGGPFPVSHALFSV